MIKILKISILRGLEDQARRASMQMTKLKRFKAAKNKMGMHLYKQY